MAAPEASEAAKPPKRRRFAIDVLDVGLARVLALLGTLGTSVIVARVLGPEGNGLIAALTVVPFLVVTFAELGTRQATTFYLGKGVHAPEAITSALVVLFLASSLIGIAICAAYFWATWDAHLTLAAVIGASALLPLALVKNYATGIFLGLERVGLFARINWLPAATYFAGLAGLALAGALSATTAVMAQAAGLALVAAYAVFQVVRHGPWRWRLEWPVVIALVRLGLVYATALFLITLNYRANVLLLREWSSLEQVGLYVVGANIAQLIWQVPGTMSAVVLSRSANARDDRAFTDKIGVLVRLSVLLGALGAAGLAMIGLLAIPLIYGLDFARSALVLACLLPG
ncbi:MAG: oligosaccharide flippase family protein, partial [Pseudomonadota bacterium]